MYAWLVIFVGLLFTCVNDLSILEGRNVMYWTLGILIIIFMHVTSLIISVLESISVCVLYSVISLSVHFVLLIILAK